MNADTFDGHWESIYASGQQLNRWPYDHVISFLSRARSGRSDRDRTCLDLLEVGFGAGNNLVAAASEGFRVAGIEGSQVAVTFAQERMSSQNLVGDLRCGDFTDLPWEAESFDLAVDRLAITHTTIAGARVAVSEIWRTLRPHGRFLLNCLGPKFNGVEVPPESGALALAQLDGSLDGVGTVVLYARRGVEELLRSDLWSIESIQLVTTESTQPSGAARGNTLMTEWRAVARKRGLES